MKSISAFVMLLILSICTISVVIAGENATPTTTATSTESATGTPTATQTTTQPTTVVTTVQPTTVVSTVQPTAQPTVAVKEGKFRVGPTVRIRPLNDEINKNQDGLIELYMDNPSLNDIPLSVDARISVPSGIHVYGQGFGEAGAAGMVYGKFEVPPGSARTINIVIKAEKIGDFSAQFTGLYWPGGNKDAYQPISLTHPFKVTAPSVDPLKDTSDKSGDAGEDKSGKTTEKSPGMTVVVAIIAIAMLTYMIRRR